MLVNELISQTETLPADGLRPLRRFLTRAHARAMRARRLSVIIARAREEGFDAIASRTRQTARGKDETEGGAPGVPVFAPI
jgi:hypothetical protein